MKNRKAILDKIEHIQEQINAIKANDKILHVIGSRSILQNELAFQEHRKATCEWALDAKYIDIKTRIYTLEADLPKEVLGVKYGLMAGIDAHSLEVLSDIELLEVAIDEHGKHKGGWDAEQNIH